MRTVFDRLRRTLCWAKYPVRSSRWTRPVRARPIIEDGIGFPRSGNRCPAHCKPPLQRDRRRRP